jgi:hypothetical protein
MVDAEFARLERRVTFLEAQNEQLRRENVDLLGKWTAAQTEAHNRLVRSLLGQPVVEEAPVPPMPVAPAPRFVQEGEYVPKPVGPPLTFSR